MKILIIGGGNMGLTYAKAFINSHVVTPEQLTILVKNNEEHVAHLKGMNLADISIDPSCVQSADLIILSVKPQDAPALFNQMSAFIEDNQIVLSIMAGIKMETIGKALGVTKIIRAMPNLPSQIGLGVTGFTATDEVTRFELGAIQNLLAQTGKTLHVSKEPLIDTVTAISGSGPAYIYYFMDSMINASKDMGLKKSESELLVIQTFLGALRLYQQNSFDCKEWISRVASKGGTTEAALLHFDKHNLSQIIGDGTKAALKRAKELGG